MEISNSIKYVGVSDKNLDFFEGQYRVPNGMSYHSYIIMDEKIAVLDTVDMRFKDEWLNNIKKELNDREPDYLVVHHMEPDHSSNIKNFLMEYKNCKIVSSFSAFTMIKNYFESDFSDRQIIIKEGDKLNLGKHTLNFISAPMVHWPEVHISYEESEGIIFSADAFGKFGALDTEEDWDCEARRYYFNIVGKYGMQVQALLKKASTLDIKTICPLHGPILKENLEHYIGQYNTWSSYKPESEGIFIACGSIHGNTMNAAKELKKILEDKGAKKVVLSDLSRDDWAECVEDAFRYGNIILMSSTYNMGIFTPMEQFLHHLKAKNYQNRTIGIVENGTWAPNAAKCMKEILEGMKDITIVEPIVTIKSTVNDETRKQLEKLADNIL